MSQTKVELIGDAAAGTITIASGSSLDFATGGQIGRQSAKIFKQSTSSSSVSSGYLTTNWASENATGTGPYGSTEVTVSSGVFSFVNTGFYRITGFMTGTKNNDVRYAGIQLISTNDNSNYNITNAYGYNQVFSSNAEVCYFNVTCQTIMDVTNTTNQKIKMYVDVESAISVQGDSVTNITGIMFERLGDT